MGSHLYRMTLKSDNTVLVEIDEEKIYEGSIKEDWEVLKPKTIADPEDKKPSDWVEDSMMDDPEDKKPDDWVEEKRIVDPEAKKPDDWDDDDDGEWEPPMKDNPAYKGDWSVKRISNPASRATGKQRRLTILSMRMTTQFTNTTTLVLSASTCGRSRVAPFSTMSSSVMMLRRLMNLRQNG